MSLNIKITNMHIVIFIQEIHKCKYYRYTLDGIFSVVNKPDKLVGRVYIYKRYAPQ